MKERWRDRPPPQTPDQRDQIRLSKVWSAPEPVIGSLPGTGIPKLAGLAAIGELWSFRLQ